jgi:hypothetical protein
MIHPTLLDLIERYLVLESFEVTEELLDLCGATLDARAVPLLKRRLQEEEHQVVSFEAKGYIRMREKSEQLVSSLTLLIKALEDNNDVSQG